MGPRLELAASPHLKAPDSTPRIMWTVVVTLLPVVAMAVWNFGPSALLVILPQALRNMVPALVTQAVVIFQDTSLAYVIGLREFLRRVNLVDAREARSVELYLFAGLVYFILCSAGVLAARRMERALGGTAPP